MFTEVGAESRSTADVEALALILGLSLNAAQAALTRAQAPWTEVEAVVFRDETPSAANVRKSRGKPSLKRIGERRDAIALEAVPA